MPIQPLANAIAATPHAQASQSAQRAAQIRRDQNRLKVSSIDQDTLERQVESTDAIEGTHDKPDEQSAGRRDRRPSRKTPKDDDLPHIDLTA